MTSAAATAAAASNKPLTEPFFPAHWTFQGRYRADGMRSLGCLASFGQIWDATDLRTDAKVIVKAELQLPEKDASDSHCCLPLEAACYKTFSQVNARHVLPLLADGYYTLRGTAVNYLVLPCVGPDVNWVQERMPTGLFTARTAYRLALEQLSCIREVHAAGWLHRDVKPHNFCFAANFFATGACRLFVIDFGMVGRWRRADGSHRPERATAGFHGSGLYASPTAHQRRDTGRRDDLCSLLYVWLGHILPLPWQGMTNRDDILPVKLSTVHQLVAHRPALHYVYDALRRMQFYDEPDYAGVAAALQADLLAMPHHQQHVLDWCCRVLTR